LLALSQLDAVVNWPLTKQRISVLPEWQIALMFTGVLMLWGFMAGAALKPAWHQPVVRFLLRQPITAKRWCFLLFPALLPALPPIFALWWLAPQHTLGLIHYGSVLLVPFPVMLTISFGGYRALALSVIYGLLVALLLYTYQYFSWSVLLIPLLALYCMPKSFALLKGLQGVALVSHDTGSLTASMPWLAVFKRDLHCLWVIERKSLLGLMQLALVLSLMMFALRVNGEVSGSGALMSAAILFALFSAAAYGVLDQLVKQLDLNLVRIQWPLSMRHRVFALFALMAVFIGPVWFALALLGSRMGGFLMLLFLLQAICIICLMLMVFCSRLKWQHKDEGFAVWGLVLIAYETGLALPRPGLIILSILLVAISIKVAIKNLGVFAAQQAVSHNYKD